MLGQIVDIYLHLDSEEFARTLANDERSFSKDLFELTVRRLDKAGIKTVDEMMQFQRLGQHATDILLQKLQEDEDFSDAPDTYMGLCRREVDCCDTLMGYWSREVVGCKRV